MLREGRVDYQQPLADIEFARTICPEVNYWQLTPTAVKRVEDGSLPMMPNQAYNLIMYLKNLEYAEEDKLAAHLDLTVESVKALLNRIKGMGYVQQVALQQQVLED